MSNFLELLDIFGFFDRKKLPKMPKDFKPVGEFNPVTLDVKKMPDEIIIKKPHFNTDAIQSYDKETKKFIYRPQTLEEYIGQAKAKELIKLNVKKIKELRAVHFLISGDKGHGKTTVAHIIKNLLDAEMIERIASQLSDPNQLIEIINTINNSKKYPILFLDEVHNLTVDLAEMLYPIMEDFKVASKLVKPFSLIGATTEKNLLVKNCPPFVDRFQVQIELEHYTANNIIEIIKQYHKQLYPDYHISDKTFNIIAQNCKFTPRIAITLLEDSLIEQNIQKVLQYHRIVKQGLTETDVKIIMALKKNVKPMGEEAISQIVGVSRADYRTVYEPFLVKQGYVIRTTRGRMIGHNADQLLQGLKI
ncbi:MAG: Holliday junction DNA helicase RuvB C-terminal domain-containing protein [Promethearchaeota archaeon]